MWLVGPGVVCGRVEGGRSEGGWRADEVWLEGIGGGALEGGCVGGCERGYEEDGEDDGAEDGHLCDSGLRDLGFSRILVS